MGNIISIFYPIYEYLIICLLSVLYLKIFSIVQHQRKITLFSKDLFFLLSVTFILMLIIFSSFRYIRIYNKQFSEFDKFYNIGGIDTLTYKKYIEGIPCYSYSSYAKQVDKEWLFTFLCFIFAKLHLSFDLFLCFINLLVSITFIHLTKIFDFKKNSFLVLFLFILFYIASFNTLRWSISLIFTIYFLEYVINENYIKAFITVILLFGIQMASIVLMVPLCSIILTKKMKYKKFAILIVILSCFVCYLPSLLDFRDFTALIGRRNQADQVGQIPLMWIAMYFVFIINIILIRKKFFLIYRNKCLSWCVLFLIAPTFIEFTFGLAYRFSGYGHVAMYSIFPYLFKENKKTKLSFSFNICYIFLLLVQIYKFLTQTIFASGVPYIFKLFY